MQNDSLTFNRFPKTLVSLALVSALSACGGGDPSTNIAATNDVVTLSVAGSVGDGPAIGADVFIFDNQGRLAASQTSDAFANYSLNFDVGRGQDLFPLTIEAIRGTDLVTGSRLDFTLKAFSMSAQQSRANLNPYTTLIVEMARVMPGGPTAANVKTATDIVVREMNFGLDLSTVPNPLTTRIDESNIGNIVRSSEALGEMIRRTRTALAYAGYMNTHNHIVTALAADLSDGRFDGRGSRATDARISATAAVASLQVVVETYMNRLKVNGNPAVQAMDNAIRETLPSTPNNAMTESVRLSPQLISQATRLIDAYTAIDNAAQYSNLRPILANAKAGSSSANMRTVLNNSHTQMFDAALTNIAQAPANTHTTLNSNLVGNAGEPNNPGSGTLRLTGTPAANVTVGNTYSFFPTLHNADGNSLTFSVQNLPSWATFNSSIGRIVGTPTAADVGSYSNISISVSDGSSTASLDPFSINVAQATSANRAPRISGTPATSVAEDSAYSFTPNASDADGDQLTFSVLNKPGWLNLNSSTGQLSGTPRNNHVGTYQNITLRVSDGQATVSLAPFNLRVTNTNDAPTISGTPAAAVNVGSAYSFTPSANDVDGDGLTFSITNRPSWASFNTSTGRLSGTPGASHSGTYGNIIIRVSDGRATAQLPAFSIRVNNSQPTNSNVRLSWVAPTARSDGTGISLSQISSYRIRYGTSAGNYTNSVTVNDGSATAYTIQNLSPATYHFVVTAIDTEGQESGYSSPVSTTVR